MKIIAIIGLLFGLAACDQEARQQGAERRWAEQIERSRHQADEHCRHQADEHCEGLSPEESVACMTDWHRSCMGIPR